MGRPAESSDGPRLGISGRVSSSHVAADPHAELEQLKSLSTFLAKPLAGMNESVRGIARAAALRERARVEAQLGASQEGDKTIAEQGTWLQLRAIN